MKKEFNKMLMVDGIETFLRGMNLNLSDQHLWETPSRVMRAWVNEFGKGYSYTEEDIKNLLSVEFSEDCDEMVVVKDIPFISHCSHHVVPFTGTAKIGYVPKKKVIGLSKLGRVLDVFASRLQVQERLTKQVAETIMKYLKPHGVGVILEATHFCMAYRGVRKPGSKMITSCLLGKMRTDSKMRQEFLDF